LVAQSQTLGKQTRIATSGRKMVRWEEINEANEFFLETTKFRSKIHGWSKFEDKK